MALTLEDILGAPTDPEELDRHLRNRGLIASPIEAPPMVAPATVGALSSVAPPEPTVKSWAPLNRENAEVRPFSGMEREMALSATNHPSVKSLSKVESPIAPEFAGPVPDTMGGINLSPVAPRVPTAKESIAAGMEQFGTTKKEEGKRQFADLRPQVTAPAHSSEFWRQKMAQDEFDKMHGWGGDISAHPGTLGKIGHALAKVGNIAGNIVAPGTMSLIPGTELNRARRESAAGEEEAKAETRESEGALKETQRKNLESEIAERGQPKEQTPEQEAYEYEKEHGKTPPEAFETVKGAGKQPREGEIPLGVQIAPLNKMLENRFQVLNPEKPLPEEYKLGAKGDTKRLRAD